MRRPLAYVVSLVWLFTLLLTQAAAQSRSKVYLVLDITVHDSERYGQYRHKAADIIGECGGRYLIRAGNLQFDGESGDGVTPAGGEWNPDRFIVLEFDSEDQMQACFESKEYREIASLRTSSATTRGIIVRGYSPKSN